MQHVIFIVLFSSLLCKAQYEFDTYGPFGSKVYTDLKIALNAQKQVYKLDLSYQPLDPKLYAKLPHLTDLQALKLSGNEVATFPNGFGNLYNLVYFASYNNAFTHFPNDLKKLVNLSYLEFFASHIDSIPNDIAYLTKLKTLKLSGTNDTLKLPTTLRYLKNLKEVTIENCILDSFPKEMFKIPHLTYLNLTHSHLFYVTKHFERLPNLEVLVLDANHLDELPYDIYKAKKLRVLSLKNNRLTKLPATISQLDDLTLLDVSGNPFSEAYLDELKALLPGCEIRF